MPVFDVEADGLEDATLVHCLSYSTDEGVKTLTTYDEMREWLAKQDTLIGHSITTYDIPLLERLLDIKVGARLIDTLALSWYLEPDRPRHGLEYYGEDFGVPKPKVVNWKTEHISVYTHRCEEDVKINQELWDKQWKLLVELYEGEQQADGFIRYLQFKMQCAADQEDSGWLLDQPKCRILLADWVPRSKELTEGLEEVMPKVAVFSKKTRPKEPFKQSGEMSMAGKRWFDLLKEQGYDKDYGGEVKVLNSWKEPNANSPVQLKRWLESLGWKPTTFKFKRNKETGEVTKIPQIYMAKNDYDDDTAIGEVCDSVKELFHKEPALELLNGLSVLNHRIGLITGFLRDVRPDGRLKARVQGLTNTLRFKHTEIVNPPGIDKPYGQEIRSVLIARKGYELCGTDMTALEDRTKQHYMHDYDPEYVAEMQKKGFCPHLDIAAQAGFITKEQQWEKGAKKTYELPRRKGKGVNYSCVYGAGGETVARSAGIPAPEGFLLVEVYWKRNWAVKAVAAAALVRKVGSRMWLYNPVSHYWYSLRHDKDRFSTLNQGTGVYVFDCWVREVKKRRRQMNGQFHDEIIQEIPLGKREECELLLRDAMKATNEKLNLNVPMDCDVAFGDNYADIH